MASPSGTAVSNGSYAARLATFQQPHQLSKRRASSTGGGRKKKNDNVVEWPHKKPSGEDLARAGFFYRPGQDSLDNVQCYFCEVKLDGWEPEDDAVKEHLSHAPHCAWATCVSAWKQDGEEEETRDPMSDAMVGARKYTFTIGDGWIHENKRGWKCKIARMVDAGWVFDPSPDTEDGVTCMHCNLSLDGWEPKDDPAEEHKRRSPDCRFFTLVEHYHGSSGPKSKKKRVGGGSTASKAGRHSVQSAMSISTFSDEPALADLSRTDLLEEADDSVMTTASTATVRENKKKGKPAKATKRVNSKTVMPVEDGNTVSYPDPNASQHADGSEPHTNEPLAVRPARVARQQTKLLDSSMNDGSASEADPKKRTRKPKAEKLKTPEIDLEVRLSDASAQLQEELEVSLGPTNDSTPDSMAVMRGVKRTSDGLRKDGARDSRIVSIEFPVPPQPVAKIKRGRKPKQSIEEEAVQAAHAVTSHLREPVEHVSDIDGDVETSESVLPKPARPVKTKKVVAKNGKGKKTSSARSSKATIRAQSPEHYAAQYSAEDMARDEQEIEAELERIAAQQAGAIDAEQEREAEFEASPSHTQTHADKIHELELELQNETLTIPNPSLNMANFIATVAETPLFPSTEIDRDIATPSPSGSDKENNPSSVVQKAATPPLASWPDSLHTARVPLAPGTPNRSPAKQILQSPSKRISNLSSSTPWIPVDLDAVLLASPQPTPNTLAQRLAGAAGMLQSPEKGLSVEDWIRYRAEQGEEHLRRKCEEMVGAFEREGMRALRTLDGLVTI